MLPGEGGGEPPIFAVSLQLGRHIAGLGDLRTAVLHGLYASNATVLTTEDRASPEARRSQVYGTGRTEHDVTNLSIEGPPAAALVAAWRQARAAADEGDRKILLGEVGADGATARCLRATANELWRIAAAYMSAEVARGLLLCGAST